MMGDLNNRVHGFDTTIELFDYRITMEDHSDNDLLVEVKKSGSKWCVTHVLLMMVIMMFTFLTASSLVNYIVIEEKQGSNKNNFKSYIFFQE